MTHLGLTLTLLIAVTACADAGRCVADCDETESTDAESTGPVCEELNLAATEFIENNRACETLLDCTSVAASCYSGTAWSACGEVALSQTADLDSWSALHTDIEDSCECGGADPCSATVMCTDAQQCEMASDPEVYCPSIQRDLDTFLAANKACEVDADCVAVESSCITEVCSIVAMNTQTDIALWRQLDEALLRCDGEEDLYCVFEGDCGGYARCSDAGQCVAEYDSE